MKSPVLTRSRGKAQARSLHARTQAKTASTVKEAAQQPRSISQKQKTRKAIVDAASAMAAEGLSPTVAEAAERAGVSRATAYRHFPSRDFLVVEMALPVGQLRLALAQAGRLDPVRRIAAMVRTIAGWTCDHQLVLREMLRVSLAPDGEGNEYLRPSTRLELIAHELQPMRHLLSTAEYRKLSTALTVLVGIEPVIALKDIAGLSREDVVETLVWTATRLTESALRKHVP